MPEHGRTCPDMPEGSFSDLAAYSDHAQADLNLHWADMSEHGRTCPKVQFRP